MKKRIRLTESQLHRVIKESVKKVLKEDIHSAHKTLRNALQCANADCGDLTPQEMERAQQHAKELFRQYWDEIKQIYPNKSDDFYEKICQRDQDMILYPESIYGNEDAGGYVH